MAGCRLKRRHATPRPSGVTRDDSNKVAKENSTAYKLFHPSLQKQFFQKLSNLLKGHHQRR